MMLIQTIISETRYLDVSEISEKVGLTDTNYYLRLFKEVIGYPARYFEAIHLNEDN